MRDIEIRINDNKTCEVVTPQPLVEGENRTTQIKLIGTPTSWTDFAVMCLLTTPAGVLVDAVPLPCELLNSMLDAAGTLKAEFIATRVGTDTEVDRTKNAALLPVSAARSPLGEIAPEPLPNFLAQMEVARTGALGAATTATEAAADAGEKATQAEGAAATTLQTNADVQAAESIRAAKAIQDAAEEQARASAEAIRQSTFSAISASPKGTYATTAALAAALPTGNANIYVVTADGGWYFWNGTTWTKGGTYQATGLPVDVARELFNTSTAVYSVTKPSGAGVTYPLPVPSGSKIKISLTGVNPADHVNVIVFNDSLTTNIGIPISGTTLNKSVEYTCTQNVGGFRVTDNANSSVVLSVEKLHTLNNVRAAVDSALAEFTVNYQDRYYPTGICDATDRLSNKELYRYANGLKIKKNTTENVIVNLHVGGDVSAHDGALVIYDGYAYALYCVNRVSLVDNASNDNSFVRLHKFPLSDPSSVTEYIVAKKTDTFGAHTITGGCGSPNLIQDKTDASILHAVFVAKVDGKYAEVTAQFNTTTSTLSGYAIVQATNGVSIGDLDVTTLNALLGSTLTPSIYNYMQANSSVAYYNGLYYVGLVYGRNATSKAVVFSTADFLTWTIVVDCTDLKIPALCECACYVDSSGILYVAIRPENASSTGSVSGSCGAFAKYSLSTHAFVDKKTFPNCSTRPSFFEKGGELYLTTSAYDREHFEIIKINKTNIGASVCIAQTNAVIPYPSVFLVGTTVYCLYTASNGMQIITLTLDAVTQASVDTAMQTLFGI